MFRVLISLFDGIGNEVSKEISGIEVATPGETPNVQNILEIIVCQSINKRIFTMGKSQGS